MSAPALTPGPLVAYDDSGDDYPKWVLDRETRHGTEQVAVITCEDAEALAALFSAAREMYEALMECVTYLPVGDAKPVLAAAAKARAALAKAEGRTT